MRPDGVAALAVVTALGLPRSGLLAVNFLLEEGGSVVVVKYNAARLPGITPPDDPPPDAGDRAPLPDAPAESPAAATVDG